ncbi:hypothetical protein E4U55_007806 [Claviceps digitariae]|nr:hypothetical protein E4U55_007806 [Claviceps digitariae]
MLPRFVAAESQRVSDVKEGNTTNFHSDIACHYSYSAHQGKPKGSLNKKTIERMKAAGLNYQRRAASQPRKHRMSRGSPVCASSSTPDNVLNLIESQPIAVSNESPILMNTTSSSYFSVADGGLPDFSADNLDAFLVE